MRVRAESPIADDHVVRLKGLVHALNPGKVVRPQRSRQHPQQKAGAGIKQCQETGHRKSAAGPLSPRLSEGFLQRGRVGHRTGRTIHVPKTVASPAGGYLRTDSTRHRLHQPLEEFQRQPRSGLAVGLASDIQIHEVGHVITGDVPRQDLPQECVDSRDRIECAIAPHVIEFATDLLDPLGQKCFGHTTLDLLQNRLDKWRILGLLWKWVV